MTQFLQQLVNGVSIGFVYALIAIGYSLIFSILSFSNFAHGSFITIGAYSGFYMLMSAHFPIYIAIPVAMLGGTVIAILADKLAYKPLRDRGSPTLYFIIAAMGMSILVDNTVIATIGPRFRSYPQLFSVTAIDVQGVSISTMDLAAAVIAAAMLILLTYLVSRTKAGIAIRAASQDLEAVGLMGVNTNLLITAVFLIAGALAGLAGFFLGMKYTVYPTLGTVITNKAYVAAVLGGLGSLPGAVVGSILLGIFEMMIAGYISSGARDVFVYLLLIIILIIKPSGLMGKKREDKV